MMSGQHSQQSQQQKQPEFWPWFNMAAFSAIYGGLDSKLFYFY